VALSIFPGSTVDSKTLMPQVEMLKDRWVFRAIPASDSEGRVIHLSGAVYSGVVDGLQAGVHYPSSLGEFQAWFASDADCLDYLAWLRWPAGFRCPSCRRVVEAWELSDGRSMCASCG